MENKSRNLLLYGILAIIIIASVSVYLYRVVNQSYEISVSISNMTSTTVYPYQPLRFNITISNYGSNPVSGMLLSIYSNNSAVGTYKVTLPAHTSTHLVENYTYQYNGTYPFKAVADPARVLNIADRNRTQASIAITVLKPASPNVYTSIPNNGINYTQSFSLFSGGVALVAYIDNFYNISISSGVLGTNHQIFQPLFSDLRGGVENMNGAFAKYSNGTNAYSIWIQGTADNSTVSTVLNTFRLPHRTVSINGTPVDFYLVSNTTSLCSLYRGGWTRITTYDNASGSGTCLSSAGRNFTPTESNLLVKTMKNDTSLLHYQSGFYYKNISILGSSLISSDSGFGFVNLFQNSFGLFLSTILQRNAPFNTTPNVTCAGLIYRNGTNNICSTYVSPIKTENASIALINTTELTGNYLIELYSLVNSSDLLNAHYNGAHLVAALGVNETSANFSSPFKNSCNLNNASIGCSVERYSSNNTATVGLTNNFSSAMRINSVACYMPGERVNETVGLDVSAASSVNFTVQCYSIPVGLTSAITSYTLVLNYTITNKTRLAVGFLNVSNYA